MVECAKCRQSVQYEGRIFSCEHFIFLMDLLLSIISYQLPQQGAAFQSSDDNNCHLLHCTTPAWCSYSLAAQQPQLWEWEQRAPLRLWETLYLRWLHFWCTLLCLSGRVHKTTQILCLYSSLLAGDCQVLLWSPTTQPSPARLSAPLWTFWTLAWDFQFQHPAGCWLVTLTTSSLLSSNLQSARTIWDYFMQLPSPKELMSPNHWNGITWHTYSSPGRRVIMS